MRADPLFWSSRRAAAWAAGLIALATLAAYHNGFSAPFVFDDAAAIVNNPTIRDLRRIGAVLTPPPAAAGAAGRPLVNLTFAINYALGGLDPRGYHAVNFGLHFLAALTLFGLVRRTLARWSALSPTRFSTGGGAQRVGDNALHLNKSAYLVALTAAVVWAVHPLLTESVMCVAQRNEVLASLFYLLTLYCVARGIEMDPAARPSFVPLRGASEGEKAARGRSWRWFGAAWLACLLGVASKEIVVSAPLIALLYDRTFAAGSFRTAWRARRGLYLGLAAAWPVLAGLMLTSHHRGGSVGFGLGVTGWDYLLTQCRAIALYLRLSVWPHPLAIDYGAEVVHSVAEVAAPAMALGLLAAATLAGLWRRSAAGFLGACFWAILAPSSSVVPLVTQTVAEHRMYLPLAAIVVLAVSGLYRVAGWRGWPIGAAAALGLGALTVRRNADYQSGVTLWQGALAANPRNARAYLNLGTLSSREGRLPEAVSYYKEALRLTPDDADLHDNLAIVLGETGRAAEALDHCREAVRLRPDLPVTHYYLGLALAAAGRTEEAIAEFADALRRQPDSTLARRHLALAQCDLANAEARAGRMPEAIAAFEAALRLEPDDAQAHNNLGNALSQTGRGTEAIAQYEAALRIQPDDAEAHYNLAAELFDAGRLEEAKAQYAEDLRLRPDDGQARQALDQIEALDRK